MNEIIINGIIEESQEVTGQMQYAKGIPGDDGVGISDISKTSTVGKVDTYTITLTDGATKIFTVTNGDDGENGISVKTASINASGHLIVTLSDGKSVDAGKAKGDTGDSGVYIGTTPPTDPNIKVWIDTSVSDGDVAMKTSNGTVISGNADYAEVGEWADGNPKNENRMGYFVAIDDTTAGTTMVKAKSTSDVRGVTVLAPAFSGNCSADKFNEDKTLKQQYEYVATMGLVSVIDNGTCTINERCIPDDNGCAVPSSNNMGYQVIDRIDDTHILIALEPNGDMVQRIKTDVMQLQNEKADKQEVANALKGSKSGELLLIDDISPVNHDMTVKISSDTVTDLTAVKVIRQGKNLIQTNIIEVTSPQGVEDLIWQGSISGKLAFSLDVSDYTPNASNVNSANFKFVFADGTTTYLAAYGSHIYLNNASPLKRIYFLNWGKGTGILKNIQLEIGSIETDYEPYISPTYYTPNTDGTVENVKSLYPHTTLMTDTEGVIITCEYNKDINTFSGADVKVPTKTSELINDSNFATKDYVDEEIANFDFIKIVTELPETGLINRTYFVPKQDAATNDLYDEYMWVDGKWELITTKQIEVDLTNYYTKTEVDNVIAEIETGGHYETVVEEIWQRNKIFTPVSFDYENQIITVSDGDLEGYNVGDKIWCFIVPNISGCTLNSLGGAQKFLQCLTVLSDTEVSISNALHADTTVANFHLESIADYFLLAKNLSAKKIRVTVNGASTVPNSYYTQSVLYGISANGLYANTAGYVSNSIPLKSSMRFETEIISPYTIFNQFSIGYNCASSNSNFHWKNNGAAWSTGYCVSNDHQKKYIFNGDGTKIENLWKTNCPWFCDETGEIPSNNNVYSQNILNICNGTYFKIERWVE